MTNHSPNQNLDLLQAIHDLFGDDPLPFGVSLQSISETILSLVNLKPEDYVHESDSEDFE